MSGLVLVVDDEVKLARNLVALLRAEGYQASSANSAAEARAAVHRLDPDVVLMDLHLPDGDGHDLMIELKKSHPAAEFIVITAHGSIRSAVESTRRGASDYLTKPFEPEVVFFAVRKALEHRALDEEVRLLRSGAFEEDGEGEESRFPSPAGREMFSLAAKAAGTDGILLLLGESGTGKDYLAHWIHRRSSRSRGPFFSINCAALARDLAESELFGHEPGAFTGARGRKRGLVEMARGGTLLLNEVGELDASLQSKLLMFLDTMRFMRVGGEKEIAVDTRIIAATNRDLQRAVDTGAFRIDLYYRLNVLPLAIPPLRQRREDIPLLARQILRRTALRLGLPSVPAFEPSSLDALVSHDWPGNIRELINVIERAVILSDGHSVRPIVEGAEGGRGDTPWHLSVPFPAAGSLHEATRDVARCLIVEALRRTDQRKTEAAALLGISRHSLAHQMKVLGLEKA